MSMAMRPYRRLNPDSGARAFDAGPDWIKVQFADGRTYLYSYASAGPFLVEQMKLLARAGKGLCTFISRHARDKYATRSDAEDT